jgi:hypothetical protein
LPGLLIPADILRDSKRKKKEKEKKRKEKMDGGWRMEEKK